MASHHHEADDDAKRDEPRKPSKDNNPRFPHPIFFIVLIVVASLIALAIHRIEPAEPGAFYTPPSPLPTGPPGTIIRTQPIDDPPSGSVGWTFMYLSSGVPAQGQTTGAPVAVTGVVFVPTTPAPAGGRNVVAWAHPTTGVDSRCAPSLEASGGAASIPGLPAFLQAGYAVVATDYQGLGTPGPHPYLVGASEGANVLDSVRAIQNLPGVDASNRFVLWGHSQGGQSVLFAAEMAPTYAPELTLVGAAAAAPASDLTALLQKDLGGLTGNVLGSMAVVSWSEVYANWNPAAQLGQVVSAEAQPEAKLIADYCIETTSQVIVDLPEAEILRVNFISNAPWTVQPWEDLLTINTPGAPTYGTIAAPLLINQGTADTVVWPEVTAGWIQTQCAANQSLTQSLYDGVTHTDIGFDSAANTATWFAARFAGQPVPTGCTTNQATFTPVTPGTTTPP